MKINTDQLSDFQGYTLTTMFQMPAYIINPNKFINFITRPATQGCTKLIFSSKILYKLVFFVTKKGIVMKGMGV
ncbi:MAG: hypothetical protein US22_C0057G0005, partial [candidate division TM6 bacterium GW2011_GWF2_36_6]